MAPYIDLQDAPPSVDATSRVLSTKDTNAASRYWSDLFQNIGSQSRLACLPRDYQWPRAETTITTPSGLLEAALGFGRTHDINLEDLIYAVWAIVSAGQMVSGQRTVVFVVAGRRQSSAKLGTTENGDGHDYPLILSVPKSLDVLSWIRNVGTAAAMSSAYASVGYERIMDTESGTRPQVKLSVNLEDDSHDTMAPDDDFPLVFNICVSGGLTLSMRHNATVPRADVRVLLDRFAVTLHRVTEDHCTNISSVDIIPPAEMQLLLDYGKAALKPRTGLIHCLVEEQARKRPDAAAVQFETEPPITYSALNKRSNQLARHLCQYNATYIAVHLRQNSDFIVALLAILKSGAAYVILDPDAPAARKSFIVDELQPGLVLVDQTTAGHLDKEVQIGGLLAQSVTHDTGDLMIDQEPSSVAYVIYTSGSTGKPKSVLLEHQAAFNGLSAYPSVAGLRQLLFFNPAFSAAQRSIWATLSVGGCLCLASKENVTVHTAQMIKIMDVNSVDMTSSAATLLSPTDVPSLRRMVLGGDMVNPTVIQKWEHRVELLSSYGLSECTQLNWRHRLHSNVSPRMIGQPYDTTTSYILVPGTTKLSPLLVPGELCLGGAQLARGYLHRPEETLHRFIQNPFGGGKLYRTGDMAVRHANGSVELVGRIDFQAKINGNRVDPGEPNSIIQGTGEVGDSAVVPASVNERTVLVAAIVSRPDTNWEDLVSKLRSSLTAKLPLYMVPHFWVSMPALPLNTNGKVDMVAIRKTVERLGESGQLLPERSHQGSMESDLTDNERLVRSLWGKILSVSESEISPKDSFISLGGTSLEAIQVVSLLQSTHGLSLRVEDILLGGALSQVAGAVYPQVTVYKGNDSPTPSTLLQLAPSIESLGIRIADVEDAFPVTPFQEAAIADTMFGGTSYIYSRSYSFEGYSYDEVKAAFETVIEFDECLRTTFVPNGTTFLQVVKKSVDTPWETPDMDVAKYMQQICKAMYPGDLWWNVAVFPNKILVITAHHALFDFWSNEFLIQDLVSVLQGTHRVRRGGFRRYVEYLQQHDDVAMQEFWQTYLDGVVPTRLGSRAAPENTLTSEINCDLKSTALQRGVTPGVLLYAAWAVVLGLVTSTEDVVMGVTISGRDAPVPGILQMSSPTLMVAPLRVKVDRASPLDVLFRDVQINLWGVARNAPYGLRKILKTSGQSKDLFDTMPNFLSKIPAPSRPGSLKLMPESNLGTAEYAKLELRNKNLDRVTLTSTLAPQYAQALVDTLVAVLRAGFDAPFTKIGELKLAQQVPGLTDRLKGPLGNVPGDFDARANEVNAPVVSLDVELAHSALQRVAVSHPSRTAVEDLSGARLTYSGLAIKMNQLAGLLREKGVVLEQIVPIMLEKSINTIVAMFGILVAGGAFLPLGPENPRERNMGIIEDCGATLIITDKENAEFFVGTSYNLVIIDAVVWDELPLQRQIVPRLSPDSLATGKPKGTLIPHSAIIAAVEGILDATTKDNSRRILWSLNYTFDGSFYPLFPTLSTGRTLCVAPQNVIVGNLAEVITKMRIDQINLTPTMASLLHPDDVPTLEILATGGEPVTHNMLNVWAPRIKVYTSYGPTEATICVTTRAVTPDMNIRNVGRPFPNTAVLILDPDTTEQLPSGSVGELCIVGPQLARGYLNRPDATKKAFQGTCHQRFYRTGDLARLLPNGEIELFGRKDDQVKINGHRMELGEVESVIMQTNAFSQCAVIAATVLKKKQLVAFYSSSVQTPGEETEQDILLPPRQSTEVDQIKAQLTTLPQYMIPTVWLPVSKLPSLTSGKIDRKRLTALVEGMVDSVLKSYLPHTGTAEINSEAEKELQSLWSSLFDIPAEGIHANSTFHSLGGDSISALSLGSMLRQHGYKIQINDILSSSTLREQAALLVKDQPNADRTAAETVQNLEFQTPEAVYKYLAQVGISLSNVEDIYPCSPGQIEFFVQGEKQDRFWQLMAVRTLPSDFDFDRWIYLTTKLTKINHILRALYVQTDSQNPQTLVQVVLKHPVLNLAYRSYRTEEERQDILEAEWQTNFDPAKPFVRYTLLEDFEGTRELVINLHHSSYDGTLLHIFDDQFQALNQNLPIKQPTPFKDFITHFMSTPKQPQLDYWTRLLENHFFDFPSSVTDPKLSSIEQTKVEAALGVNDLASSTGVTAPVVFQTAFSLLLAHLSGARDVVYDNLVTGRNVALDNPQLINGNCANFLPFISHVADDMSIEAVLRSTQADFWTSTENGLVSLGEIYEALGRDRATASAKCLFCFQPFEPVTDQQDPMRWVVMKMSKNRMHFNYAIQMEVVKAAAKGEYIVRFGYDCRAFSSDRARMILEWYTRCLGGMVKGKMVGELGI
ncbi:Nonribosomal peptide synthetase 7 [Aspergillus floccosus]